MREKSNQSESKEKSNRKEKRNEMENKEAKSNIFLKNTFKLPLKNIFLNVVSFLLDETIKQSMPKRTRKTKKRKRTNENSTFFSHSFFQGATFKQLSTIMSQKST